MQWENLSSLDFVTAVEKSQGVGIIPLGVLEAHGSHLPLGTDVFTAHWIACHAAEQEPVIVFPAYPFGANAEAAHLPGGLVLKQEVILDLLENICDEMARNGLQKIILISGHGGNRFFLSFFVQMLAAKRKPYVVYFINTPYFPPKKRKPRRLHRLPQTRRRRHMAGVPINRDNNHLATEELGHACEWETSLLRHIREDLVHIDEGQLPFTNQRRNQALTAVGAYSQVDWYSMYPDMVVGDPRPATAEKGQIYLETAVATLVRAIQTIKADTITPQLVAEFNARAACPQAPPTWNKPPLPANENFPTPQSIAQLASGPEDAKTQQNHKPTWRTLYTGMRHWLFGF